MEGNALKNPLDSDFFKTVDVFSAGCKNFVLTAEIFNLFQIQINAENSLFFVQPGKHFSKGIHKN